MNTFRLIFLALFSVGMVSCGSTTTTESASGSKLKVVTTIAPLYSMTVNVAGEYADVTNLVPIGASEHTYQARPSDVALLSKADVVIKNGIGLETFLDPLLASSESSTRMMVDTSSGVTLLAGGEHHEHEDEDEHMEEKGEGAHEQLVAGDPHIWLSIENAKIQVKNIERALSAADPDDAVHFQKNAAAYITHLNTLQDSLKAKLATLPAKPYILFHDGFQYFEKEFALKSAGVVQEFPGKEPSVQYLKSLYDTIETLKVSIAFTEPQFSPKVIEQLKNRFGLVTAEIDTVGTSLTPTSYEELMTKNVQAFVDTFSKVQ